MNVDKVLERDAKLSELDSRAGMSGSFYSSLFFLDRTIFYMSTKLDFVPILKTVSYILNRQKW